MENIAHLGRCLYILKYIKKNIIYFFKVDALLEKLHLSHILRGIFLSYNNYIN